jgi:hypothetical protein
LKVVLGQLDCPNDDKYADVDVMLFKEHLSDLLTDTRPL